MLKASNLAALKGVRHGFFSRLGGVSIDVGMSGLNCGFGSEDTPENVAQNREIALQRLGAADRDLVTTYQVHSSIAVRVRKPWQREQSPKADAMASDCTDVVLGILTADCAPVLFADSTARVVGAAHAGWRGARGGVLEQCLAEMCSLGADLSNISAAVGPCIAQNSYEVGPEFYEEFIDEDLDNIKFFNASSQANHFMFDLTGYVEKCLFDLGLESVEGLGLDTFAEPERFYSYRRCTLNGENCYGRLLSAIMLET
jgi:YfiH family protein